MQGRVFAGKMIWRQNDEDWVNVGGAGWVVPSPGLCATQAPRSDPALAWEKRQVPKCLVVRIVPRAQGDIGWFPPSDHHFADHHFAIHSRSCTPWCSERSWAHPSSSVLPSPDLAVERGEQLSDLPPEGKPVPWGKGSDGKMMQRQNNGGWVNVGVVGWFVPSPSGVVGPQGALCTVEVAEN